MTRTAVEDVSVSATLSVHSSSVDVQMDTSTERISTAAKHVNVFQVDYRFSYFKTNSISFSLLHSTEYWKPVNSSNYFIVSVCGPVCQKYCKHGMVMDEYGCPICQCWEPHPCEVVNFAKYCIFSAK